MPERKTVPRYVEVTSEEALDLFKTSSEEADAVRKRLLANYALRTAEDVPVVGVIMGDQNGKKVPARMIDLSGDLGTTLNPNKHLMPHPRQVEAKKVEMAEELPRTVASGSREQPPLWPEDDSDVQPPTLDTPPEKAPKSDVSIVETSPEPASDKRINETSDSLVVDDTSMPSREIAREESAKENNDPLALTKELTRTVLEHHPQAYLHNRETLVHVLSGRYGEELQALRGGDVSDENLKDIYDATDREALDIKSEIGRLEQVGRKTTQLIDNINEDLKNKTESYAVFEGEAQKRIGAYSELAKVLVATADDVETLVNNLQVGRVINSGALHGIYEDIFARQRAYEHHYSELSSRREPLQEKAAAQLTSFQYDYENLDEGMGEIYRMRNQEGDLSEAMSAEEVADRVSSLGNPSSIIALRHTIDDEIDDQLRKLKKKQDKIEDFVHALAGVKNEADSLDMTVLPDEHDLRTRTQMFLTALSAYETGASTQNSEFLKEEVIHYGRQLRNSVLDDLTLAKVRGAVGSSADLELKLRAAHAALNELES